MPPQQRATFTASELAVALSHYELGVIESLTELPRGSRKSPKVGVVCQRGRFLLKRLAPGRYDEKRILAKHRLHRILTSAGFPAPALMPTRSGNETFLRLREKTYELFEFVSGRPYAQSPPETRDAGATLARFHQITIDLAEDWTGPAGDYHDASGVRSGLCAIGASLSSHDSFAGMESELISMVEFLLSAYDSACDAVNRLGLASMPGQVIHSDYHPGNLLFRNDRVQGVFDFDSARLSRKVLDVANGLLQFSMIAEGDPATWPDHLDEQRLFAFLEGVEEVTPLTGEEARCLPHLMAESLIAECVPPISRTGSIGRWSGFRVLQAICRKLGWLAAHSDRLFKGHPA